MSYYAVATVWVAFVYAVWCATLKRLLVQYKRACMQFVWVLLRLFGVLMVIWCIFLGGCFLPQIQLLKFGGKWVHEYTRCNSWFMVQKWVNGAAVWVAWVHALVLLFYFILFFLFGLPFHSKLQSTCSWGANRFTGFHFSSFS